MNQHQIRELRIAKGYTQKQFAEKLGVTEYAVRSWEQGVRNPSEPVKRLMLKLQ